MTGGTLGTLFAGGGLADVGAMVAGLTPTWAVEKDADVAACYARNLPGRMLVADVATVDPADFPTPTLLWASPPCPDFSVARSKSLPVDATRADLGRHVLRFVKALRPPAVCVENVGGYKSSPAFSAIVEGLFALGYAVDCRVIDASDYGVPQSRRRLFVRAVLGGLLLPLPAPVRPKRGWYDAISDLIPALPESRFAAWQLKRLRPLFGTALVDSKNSGSEWGDMCRMSDEPAMTVTADPRPAHRPAAFLVHTQISQSLGAPVVRDGDEPGPLVTTNSHGRLRAFLQMTGNTQMAHPTGTGVLAPGEPANTVTSGSGHARAWLDGGRVVKLTPRALGRLQSLPDWYELPASNALAGTILGNGVPCDVARMLCENLLLAVDAAA